MIIGRDKHSCLDKAHVERQRGKYKLVFKDPAVGIQLVRRGKEDQQDTLGSDYK